MTKFLIASPCEVLREEVPPIVFKTLRRTGISCLLVLVVICTGCTGHSDASASATDAPAATDAPTDTPAPLQNPLESYDYTISTKDHKNIVCFGSEDDYNKFSDETVNHDQEAAQQTFDAASQIPSGSRVHVIATHVFHGYAELRNLADGSECFTTLTDNVYYHNQSQDGPSN